MIKKIVLILVFLSFFSFPVSAQESVYEQEYKAAGIAEIKDALDETTRSFFEESGLDPEDYNWTRKLTEKGFFSQFLAFIGSGFSAPLKAGVYIVSIILICAAFSCFSPENSAMKVALYAAVIAVCSFVANDIWQSISISISAVKSCSSFMIVFVPVFAGVVVLSGAPVTAASMSGLLLGAAEGVSAVCSFFVVPLMGCYTAVSISCAVSDFAAKWNIADILKKVSVWGLSLVSTVFVGILTIQTTVNTAADNLTLKTARFVLGTTVPVVGGALSEAVGTVASSLSLLRSSVGIYGVVALAAILLPCIMQLLMWRLVLNVTAGVSEMFDVGKIAAVLKAADGTISVLLGVMLTVAAMFIISITCVVAVK